MTHIEAKKQLQELARLEVIYNKKLRMKIKSIQDQCVHEWTFYPDPSGNNDSGYCCTGCKLWTKRIW